LFHSWASQATVGVDTCQQPVVTCPPLMYAIKTSKRYHGHMSPQASEEGILITSLLLENDFDVVSLPEANLKELAQEEALEHMCNH